MSAQSAQARSITLHRAHVELHEHEVHYASVAAWLAKPMLSLKIYRRAVLAHRCAAAERRGNLLNDPSENPTKGWQAKSASINWNIGAVSCVPSTPPSLPKSRRSPSLSPPPPPKIRTLCDPVDLERLRTQFTRQPAHPRMPDADTAEQPEGSQSSSDWVEPLLRLKHNYKYLFKMIQQLSPAMVSPAARPPSEDEVSYVHLRHLPMHANTYWESRTPLVRRGVQQALLDHDTDVSCPDDFADYPYWC